MSINNEELKIIFSKLELKEKLLEFLQSTDLDLENKCLYFRTKCQEDQQNQFRAFVITLFLDYNELKSNIEQELLDLIIKETIYFEILLREIIFCSVLAIFEKHSIKIPLVQEQIHCAVRFSGLPLVPEYQFDLHSVHLNIGLSVFHCAVYSLSPPEKYVRQTVWFCPGKCSETVATDPLKALKCLKCAQDCIEQTKFRDLADYCLIQVFPIIALSTSKTPRKTHRTITLRLVDDLCKELKLGHEYLVIGRFDPFKNLYEVWNIQKL